MAQGWALRADRVPRHGATWLAPILGDVIGLADVVSDTGGHAVARPARHVNVLRALD